MLGAFWSEDKLGRRLIVILRGNPCTWGKCVFCPFGVEQGSLPEVIRDNARIIEEAMRIAEERKAERISIFNGGSFYELPADTIARLYKLTRNRVVDIESRPEFITKDSAEWALRALGARMLVIRVGLEVADERIRNEVLRKGIPEDEVRRLAELRKELAKEEPRRICIVAYVLFGIKGVPEEKVVESVEKFNELFDGVIAIKYHKHLPHHPEEKPVSRELARFLEEKCLLVDWGTGEEWVFESSRS